MSKWPYSTATWQRLREAKLSDQPLCEACLRRDVVEPAVAVDHIVGIASGGEPFPPLTGLMSMCEPCHNAKTNAVDHPGASGFRRALKGYDVNGNPIDPSGWDVKERKGTPSPGCPPSSEQPRESDSNRRNQHQGHGDAQGQTEANSVRLAGFDSERYGHPHPPLPCACLLMSRTPHIRPAWELSDLNQRCGAPLPSADSCWVEDGVMAVLTQEPLGANSACPPGAEAGRAIDTDGPARESRVDLVSCEPFATRNPEAERWV